MNGRSRLRVLHVAVNYDSYEATGRSLLEVAVRLDRDVEPVLVTNRVMHGGHQFAGVREVGGSASTFQITRRRAIRRVMDALQPDLVHLHGGLLTVFLARALPARPPVVLSVLAWPRPPRLRELRRGSLAEAHASQALKARVLVAAIVPPALLARSLRAGPTRGILTPDPHVSGVLAPLTSLPVRQVFGGASVDGTRATFDACSPTVVFAGRAEAARGIDVLIDAMPRVVAASPKATLRLCLLSGPDDDQLRARATASPVADHINVSFGPVDDLRGVFARATVAAFPFKYAYTTSAPPLAVTEAMSVGLPVVATPVRCMEPVVQPGCNAVTVPVGDPVATAEALCGLLADEGLWDSLADGAYRTIAARWNWDAAADATRALYEEVLGAPPGRS